MAMRTASAVPHRNRQRREQARARRPHRSPTPVGAHARRRRRSWLVPTVVAVLALVAVLLWQVLGLFPSDSPAPAKGGHSAAPAAAAVAKTEVSLGDTGSMHVVETLTFMSAQTRLDLALPQRRGVGRQFTPTVTGLKVSDVAAGDEPGPLRTGDTASARLSGPQTRVVLEYDVTGGVVRSGDANNPERALALVAPLTVKQAESLPSSVSIESVKVLNVGCLRGAELTGCGTQTASGWTVETTGGRGAPVDVLAQVNLAVP